MPGKARVGASVLFVAGVAVVGLFALRDDDDRVNRDPVFAATKSSRLQKKRTAENESEMTSGQRLALQAAREYFDLAGLSKASVMYLLASDGALLDPGHWGFSKTEARFAVNNAGADWRKEAVEAARAHLEFDPWTSRDELIYGLSARGVSSAFLTPAEADYAVDVVLPWGEPRLDPDLVQNRPVGKPTAAASPPVVTASGSEAPW